MANNFINKKVDLTTTDLTTLYTVPTAKTSVVKSILVSNDAGSGCNIDVTLVDASGNIFSLFKTKTIATITTTELLTNPLVMEESEVLNSFNIRNTAKRGYIMNELKPEKIIETITNKKTGEQYTSDNEWKAKNVSPEDIRRDVTIVMPSLDLLGKTK